MQLSPYLIFDGRCREAFEFYQRCLGGEIAAMVRYSDMPATDPDPGTTRREGIMHARLDLQGQTLMGSDGPTEGTPRSTNVFLEVPGLAHAEELFTKLSEGGEVRMPMAETFWAERFGMCTDKFGVPWMVSAPKQG